MVNDVFELYKVEEIKESSYKNYPNYKFPMIFRYLSDHVDCMYATLIFILTSAFTFRETIISLFKTLFFKNGNFQWIAFTALVGFGTLVYNVHSTHKNNYYNTISKARIEWLKEHRNNMAKLILDCEVCLFKLKELVFLNKQSMMYGNEVSLKEDELSNLCQEIQLIINNLVLQLGPNDDNAQFIECINDCGKWATSVVSAWEKVKYNSKCEIVYETVVQKNMMIVSQEYYKREWEKAKAGR